MWDEERAEEEEKRRDRADFLADRKREDEWAEKIPTIEIPCILWKKRAVGVALRKLRAGLNIIKVTAKNKEGEVNTAKANPFPNPTSISPERAHAEKTINVCPQGSAIVKKPNKKAGHALSRNISKERV